MHRRVHKRPATDLTSTFETVKISTPLMHAAYVRQNLHAPPSQHTRVRRPHTDSAQAPQNLHAPPTLLLLAAPSVASFSRYVREVTGPVWPCGIVNSTVVSQYCTSVTNTSRVSTRYIVTSLQRRAWFGCSRAARVVAKREPVSKFRVALRALWTLGLLRAH